MATHMTDVRVFPSENGLFVVGKEAGEVSIKKILYLHQDGKWRETTRTIDPENPGERPFTGYFESIHAANQAICKWQASF